MQSFGDINTVVIKEEEALEPDNCLGYTYDNMYLYIYWSDKRSNPNFYCRKEHKHKKRMTTSIRAKL